MSGYIDQNVEPCKFCGSNNIEFTIGTKTGVIMGACKNIECGATVSFNMPIQSPKEFFVKWNGDKNAPRKSTAQ